MAFNLFAWRPVRLGWATTRIANPVGEHARAKVFLLRGQGIIFSTGFGRLCTRLRRAHIWAEDLCCVGDFWLCRHLLGEQSAGRLQQPVILVGHSRGGRRALAAAEQLRPHGLTVDLLICVDVAFAAPIPANVRHAVHLYRGKDRHYPARPLVAGKGFVGQLGNVDLDAPAAPFSGDGINHLNITGNGHVQEWLFERIIERLG